EEEVAKFNKQLADGSKLQKDFKAYLAAVKTMHECSKRLLDCLAEMYDPEWFGKEEVDSIAEDTDLLWQDFHQNLVDNNLISMDTYLAQFPDIKARIAKRERKLVDFDSARHHFTSIQKSKKKDEAKIAKAEEDLGRAQKVFEEINYDLQEELPTLWNSRVGLYVNTFQSVAGLEEKFHRDMGKLNLNLMLLSWDISSVMSWRFINPECAVCPCVCVCMCVLVWQSRERPPVSQPPRPASSQEVKQDNIIDLFEDAVVPEINISTQPQPGQSPAADPSQQWDTDEEAAAQSYSQQPFEAPRWDEQESVSAQSGWGNETATPAQPDWEGDGVEHWGEEGSQVGQKQDADTNWGRGTAQAWEAESERPQWEELQIVKAIHDYGATDSDELDLKAGDIVLVLAFANPDEQVSHGTHVYTCIQSDNDSLSFCLCAQDDGWLMGVKESHWLQNKNLLAKGVFPENFTQKL
uniref:Myc box-dependent-interacting protein 1-like n=1 Tax=Sinocyclocheilus rhinocerous TaxID=307959 RepID=A0A673JZR4_9TELE